MDKLILASASPRRRELLAMLGIDFDIMPSDFEADLDLSLHPGDASVLVALQKARNVSETLAQRHSNLPLPPILAADTIVYHNGVILEKPCDADEAFSMLKRLSGSTHKVYSGIVLLYRGLELCAYEETSVTFRTLSDFEIKDYISTGEPADKAGAYGAQGRGALFIERIEGDFFNIVGLPLCRLGQMLNSIKLDMA